VFKPFTYSTLFDDVVVAPTGAAKAYVIKYMGG